MDPDASPLDLVLPDLRRLMARAGVAYRIVGGVAVVHHGYLRTTRDVDVLVEPQAQAELERHLAACGFARESATRLRHTATGVPVDLLIAGAPMPRPGSPAYPSPGSLASSAEDAAIVGLVGLLGLKLAARRHQDRADVVQLLKRVEESDYIVLEAATSPALRPELARLREDALEELAWERAGEGQ